MSLNWFVINTQNLLTILLLFNFSRGAELHTSTRSHRAYGRYVTLNIMTNKTLTVSSV